MQPALPALVAEWFADRIGFATAVCANGLLISEALPAALTIPWILSLVGGSWPVSFAIWAIPVAATALLVARCFKCASFPRAAGAERVADEHRPEASASWWPAWRGRETWQLGLMMGGTGGL